MYVPADYDPGKSYEMVMFLHGDGEAGSRAGYNNTAQLNTAINNLTVNAENRDYLLYVPQAPYTYWSDEQLTMAQAAFAPVLHMNTTSTPTKFLPPASPRAVPAFIP